MTPDEKIAALEKKVRDLEFKLGSFMYKDRFQFDRTVWHKGNYLGFYSADPIVQWSSGTGRQDVNGDTGSAAKRGTQYDGNLGGTAYSVGDLVAFLKTRGDIAQ